MKKAAIIITAISLLFACEKEPAKTPPRVVPDAQAPSIIEIITAMEKEIDRLELQSKNLDRDPFLDQERHFEFVIENAPAQGAQNPKLTMVVFSDFQCPACGRFAKIGQQLVDKFPDDLRLVFMNFPLDSGCNSAVSTEFHPMACEYANAAMAAHQQGMFWQMHDWIFQNQRADAEMIAEFAQTIGLDGNMVKSAMNSGTFNQDIQEQAKQLPTASRSTPTVFINGYKVQRPRWGSLETSAAFIAELLEPDKKNSPLQTIDVSGLPATEVVLEDGTGLAERLELLRSRLAALALDPQKGDQISRAPDMDRKFDFRLEGRPRLGTDNANVTMVVFLDLLSPHSESLAPILFELSDKFGDKLNIVFKFRPTPGLMAREAHEAAYAAADQEKFQEILKPLLETRNDISQQKIEQILINAGLDMGKARTDIAENRYRKLLVEDMVDARKAGVRLPPAIFVNSVFVKNLNPREIEKAVNDALEKH